MASKIKVEVDFKTMSSRSLRAMEKAEYYKNKRRMLEEKTKFKKAKAKTRANNQDMAQIAKKILSGELIDNVADSFEEIGLNPLRIKPLTPSRINKFFKKKTDNS